METLKKHLPVSVPDEGLGELHKTAMRFEEKICTAATNQNISLKMLSMESQTNTQQNPGNAQVISNQTPPVPASADSTAQSGLPGTRDFREELYQMIKSLKDQHFAELNYVYNEISRKIQHIDNHRPSQKSGELYEKLKGFNKMLERTMNFLQVDKSSIQPRFILQLPIYKRHILIILSSLRRKPGVTAASSPVSVTDSAAASGSSAAPPVTHVRDGGPQEKRLCRRPKKRNPRVFGPEWHNP